MVARGRFGALSVMLVALAVAMSACGDDDTPASEGSGNDGASLGAGKRITLIIPSLQNDYYIAQKKGAEEIRSQYSDADVSIVTGTGDGSGADLIARVEDALTKQADVIAINSGNPDALKAVLERAASQGAKVVLFDTPIPEFAEQTAWVGADNLKSGTLAGDWLAEELPQGGEVGILHCLPGIKITDDRVKGFRDAIAGSGFNVVSTLDAKCDRAKGRAVMEDMLSAHPNVKGVYSISDTQTLGAVGALPKSGDGPVVVSIDAQAEAVKNIAGDGGITASVSQDPERMGAVALETAIKVSAGRSVPKETFIPQVVVDEANVAEQEG